MRSMLYDIHRTGMNAIMRAGYSIIRVLTILGISRSWYYSQMSFSPLLNRRFNSFAEREEKWIVIGFRKQHPRMSFSEIAYTLIDEGLEYLSPGTVYNILKKNNLITRWKHPIWESTRPEHAKHPDERWQTDIMYIRIIG